jgi:hypothetical protein
MWNINLKALSMLSAKVLKTSTASASLKKSLKFDIVKEST